MKQFNSILPPDISTQDFLQNYWQKKPLLLKNALPEINDLLIPDDVFELATMDEVTARLITQDNSDASQWNIDFSPLTDMDLQSIRDTTQLWTLLVQNLEQWSFDIAMLWQKFSFIPAWQQDDIMVSYAPKGGSVGMHYDDYDVFLVQGYGKRRWQLGKFCDQTTDIIPNQPLRLISEMGDIISDEVLEPGDVLYVPPRLSHYGVAQNDCLTFSFGYRRPNPIDILDGLVDQLSQHDDFKNPCTDSFSGVNSSVTNNHHINEINQADIQALATQITNLLGSEHGQTLLQSSIKKTISQRRFELVKKEDDEFDKDSLLAELAEGAVLIKEPAIKLLYTQSPLQFFSGEFELNEMSEVAQSLLLKLANNLCLAIDDINNLNSDDFDSFLTWLNEGLITFDYPEDE